MELFRKLPYVVDVTQPTAEWILKDREYETICVLQLDDWHISLLKDSGAVDVDEQGYPVRINLYDDSTCPINGVDEKTSRLHISQTYWIEYMKKLQIIMSAECSVLKKNY